MGQLINLTKRIDKYTKDGTLESRIANGKFMQAIKYQEKIKEKLKEERIKQSKRVMKEYKIT